MRQSAVVQGLARLGDLRLTLVGLVLLTAAVILAYQYPLIDAWWLALPLLLLALNLLAALIANPRFRRQGGLLVFHICLLGVIVIAAIDRLSFINARVEISQGQRFSTDQVEIIDSGPWHRNRFDQIRFEQGPIEVDYARELRRGRTESHITTIDNTGRPIQATVGDDRPFKVGGYRFYTTSNKGFAVIVTWIGDNGSRDQGAVHLPSYPLWEWKQTNSWQTPAGQNLELALPALKPVPQDRDWRLTPAWLAGTPLVVDMDGQEHTLQPGDTVVVAGGRIRFDGLRMWMGYRVSYSQYLPWLFAAALVGVLGLGWYFWGKFSPPSDHRFAGRDPTQPEPEHG